MDLTSDTPCPRRAFGKRPPAAIGPSDVIEIAVDLGDGPPRTIARVRAGDAGRIIGDVAWGNGGAEWGQRTWTLATDGKTILFKNGGAMFTEMAAGRTTRSAGRTTWSDDEVGARFEVRDLDRDAPRTALAIFPPSRRPRLWLLRAAAPPPAPPAQMCKELHAGHFTDVLDRKFSNNVLLMRGS